MFSWQKILEAEQQCQLRNYQLEREWKRVENRLDVAQLRLDRAKQTRDEYLLFLQRKYPSWRHQLTFHTDELASEALEPTSSAIRGNFIDQLATRKYWDDLDSAPIRIARKPGRVSRSPETVISTQTADNSADIDWIKRRLETISSELRRRPENPQRSQSPAPRTVTFETTEPFTSIADDLQPEEGETTLILKPDFAPATQVQIQSSDEDEPSERRPKEMVVERRTEPARPEETVEPTKKEIKEEFPKAEPAPQYEAKPKTPPPPQNQGARFNFGAPPPPPQEPPPSYLQFNAPPAESAGTGYQALVGIIQKSSKFKQADEGDSSESDSLEMKIAQSLNKGNPNPPTQTKSSQGSGLSASGNQGQLKASQKKPSYLVGADSDSDLDLPKNLARNDSDSDFCG